MWVHVQQLSELEPSTTETKKERHRLATKIYEESKKAYECANVNQAHNLLDFTELYLATLAQTKKIELAVKADLIEDVLKKQKLTLMELSNE